MEHNLDDLRVVVTGSLDRLQLGVRDVAARPDHLRRETHRGAGLRVRGGPFAVRGDLCVVELREVLAEVGVRRQAVVAAVDLRDGKGEPLSRPGVDPTLAEAAVEAEVALERRRAADQVVEAVRAGRLEVVLRGFEPPPRPIQIVYPTTRLLSAKVRAFVELATTTRDWKFVDL